MKLPNLTETKIAYPKTYDLITEVDAAIVLLRRLNQYEGLDNGKARMTDMWRVMAVTRPALRPWHAKNLFRAVSTKVGSFSNTLTLLAEAMGGHGIASPTREQRSNSNGVLRGDNWVRRRAIWNTYRRITKLARDPDARFGPTR